MYKSFYKLKRNPFEITPDPSFLFPTRRHNEALAALYYGVRRHKGFVVMTGEVGTGKTLLVRCLLELLNRKNVAYAYVFNSILSPDGIPAIHRRRSGTADRRQEQKRIAA